MLWTLAIALLVLAPAGRVSGDGLGYATAIARGVRNWNPNHLLFEPLIAAWSDLVARAGGVDLPIVDRSRLLSVVAGALTVGLFRWGVARRLAFDRRDANWMTACLVLGASFAQALVADEPHLVRLPLLCVAAIGILRSLERPSAGRGFAAGAALGAAALLFLADGLFALTAAVALAVRHRRDRAPRHAIAAAGGVLGAAAAVASVGFALAWWRLRPGPSFLAWLTSYGGGLGSERIDLVFGTRWTLDGVVAAVARTAYGCANVLVDLIPAVAAARDDGALWKAALIGAAWVSAAAAIVLTAAHRAWRRRHRVDGAARRAAELEAGADTDARTGADARTEADATGTADAKARDALLLQAVWWPAMIGFGLYWNDSSSQFYLPLALALALLAPRLLPSEAGRRTVATVTLLFCFGVALAWNATDTARRFVLYPRAERLAALERETAGAGLVVVPGWDEASDLAALSTPLARIPRIELAPLAVEKPAADALLEIDRAIAACLASGRRVDLVDLYDVPPARAPWKLLRALGWERSELHRSLSAHGVDAASRRAEGFKLRSIEPEGSGAAPPVAPLRRVDPVR